MVGLQKFHDTIEFHVRGSESLESSYESYGDLLVPIILGKQPHELRKILACEHDGPDWKFQKLNNSIVKEIRILEAGDQLKSPHDITSESSSAATSSFLTQT